MLIRGAGTLLLGLTLALGCKEDASAEGTDQPPVEGESLPDGDGCEPAPSDAEGAREAWEAFLVWHANNAEACGVSDTWPSYDCAIVAYDPRRIAEFSACLMADGCNTISAEDRCLVDPSTRSSEELEASLVDELAWLEENCFPKAEECGVSDDLCGALITAVVRPELRCALRTCLAGPCDEIEACADGLFSEFAACSQ